MMSGSDIVFLICACICGVSAAAIVSRKNPVYSVVYMLPFFLSMATLFVLLQATFLAAIQMIVYGGAILVLFLFVIMLINLKPEELRDDFAAVPYALTTLAAAAFAGALTVAARAGLDGDLERGFAAELPGKSAFGSIASLAAALFKQQEQLSPLLVPFELISVLLVVAILGAVLLSKKRL